jgi:hypothetical protein
VDERQLPPIISTKYRRNRPQAWCAQANPRSPIGATNYNLYGRLERSTLCGGMHRRTSGSGGHVYFEQYGSSVKSRWRSTGWFWISPRTITTPSRYGKKQYIVDLVGQVNWRIR